MIFLQRLVDAPEVGKRAGIEQVSLGRLEIGPALLQVIHRRQCIGRTFPSELSLRLAERIDRLGSHRQRQNVIVMALGFVEPADPFTLDRKRRAICNRVRIAESRFRQFAVLPFRGSSLSAMR